jgi:tRNA(fMet)-specific endonuclease VapC
LAGQLSISAISLAELFCGVEKSSRPEQNRQAVEQFVARLDVLPFSASAAFHYGEIRVALEREGRPMGANDMLIGAHTRSEGMIIVTNNLREFERIPGLRTENWV